MLAADNGRAAFERTTTLIVRGDDHPHVFTPYPEGAPAGAAARPPPRADVARHRRRGRGARAHARRHRRRRATRAGSRSTTTPRRCGSASPSCSHRSSSRTPLPCSPPAACTRPPTSSSACAARGRSTKAATYAAEQALRPGIRLTDLTAVYFRRFFELGGTCNFLDPVWQTMPERIADGPVEHQRRRARSRSSPATTS